MSEVVTLQPVKGPWVRAQDGILAGVCAGIARRFDFNPWLARLALVGSTLTFGVGIMFYIILAFTLPREDKVAQAQEKKFLGVCSRFAKSSDLDVGLVRAGTVLIGLTSFGVTVVGYFILHVLLPETSLGDKNQLKISVG